MESHDTYHALLVEARELEIMWCFVPLATFLIFFDVADGFMMSLARGPGGGEKPMSRYEAVSSVAASSTLLTGMPSATYDCYDSIHLQYTHTVQQILLCSSPIMASEPDSSINLGVVGLQNRLLRWLVRSNETLALFLNNNCPKSLSYEIVYESYVHNSWRFCARARSESGSVTHCTVGYRDFVGGAVSWLRGRTEKHTPLK